MDSELERLERRLTVLESRNRWLAGLLACAVVIPILPMFTAVAAQPGSQAPAVVRAERFEIVSAGKTVATLKGRKIGSGRDTLGIFMEAGETPAVVVGSRPDGGYVNVLKSAGEAAVEIKGVGKGGAVFVGNNANQAVAVLSADDAGSGRLRLGQGDAKPVVELYSNLDGGNLDLRTFQSRRSAISLWAKHSGTLSPALTVSTNEDMAGVVLSGERTGGGGSLEVRGQGRSRISLSTPTVAVESPKISISDDVGNEKVELGVYPDGQGFLRAIDSGNRIQFRSDR